MVTVINLSLSLMALHFSPLLSTNHKSTHPCLNVVQKRMLKWRTTTTSRSFRRVFTSQPPVEEAATAAFILDIGETIKDLHACLSECNKVTLSYLRFEHCLLIYSLIMSIICV